MPFKEQSFNNICPEIYRQMKGLCGDYQVSNNPQIGMTLNMGGDDKTVVSLILKNG